MLTFAKINKIIQIKNYENFFICIMISFCKNIYYSVFNY